MMLTIIAPLGFALTAGGFWSAALWRCVQGIGLAGTYMPGLKLLTDIVPKSAQSRTVAWYTSFFYVGAALSLSYGTNLNAYIGWRWIWMFSAIRKPLENKWAVILFQIKKPFFSYNAR